APRLASERSRINSSLRMIGTGETFVGYVMKYAVAGMPLSVPGAAFDGLSTATLRVTRASGAPPGCVCASVSALACANQDGITEMFCPFSASPDVVEKTL